jgi:hypothetical protein
MLVWILQDIIQNWEPNICKYENLLADQESTNAISATGTEALDKKIKAPGSASAKWQKRPEKQRETGG